MGKSSKFDNFKIPDIPQSWHDVDPVSVVITVVIVWILLCLLCNVVACLLNCLRTCLCGWRGRSGGYTTVGPAYRTPPAYNPEYIPPRRRYAASSAADDSTCRNLLWGLCCFECCCRDNKDVDCCELCCGLCIYEMCCPRQQNYSTYV